MKGTRHTEGAGLDVLETTTADINRPRELQWLGRGGKFINDVGMNNRDANNNSTGAADAFKSLLSDATN